MVNHQFFSKDMTSLFIELKGLFTDFKGTLLDLCAEQKFNCLKEA